MGLMKAHVKLIFFYLLINKQSHKKIYTFIQNKIGVNGINSGLASPDNLNL